MGAVAETPSPCPPRGEGDIAIEEAPLALEPFPCPPRGEGDDSETPTPDPPRGEGVVDAEDSDACPLEDPPPALP